jgi:Flp pilus assembly pilin Flp
MQTVTSFVRDPSRSTAVEFSLMMALVVATVLLRLTMHA